LIGIVATFLIISMIVFYLFRQVGDPMTLYAAGGTMSEQQIAELRASFGLDEPLYVQYLQFLINLGTLDFGLSFFYKVPTDQIVIDRLINTLYITFPSILLAYIIGIFGGVYLGYNRDTASGKMGLMTAILFRSTPRFFTALVLVYLFSVQLGIFPLSGMLPVGTNVESKLQLLTIPEFYRHLALPVASLTVYMIALPLLLMRTSILDTMNEDFVTIVRAKGASKRRIRYKHVARNAMLPVTTAFGIAIGFTFGGAVLVEKVFAYPGIGRLMVNSVFRGDYPTAQLSFLIMAAALLIMNFVVDITYGYLDPTVVYD